MSNSNVPIHTASVADLADAIAAAIAGGSETLADVINQLQLLVTSLGDVDLNTDGVETAIASTNTKLDTIAGYLDTLEALLAANGGKTLKFAAISETGADQAVIAAAGASQSIKVCLLHFMVSEAATVTWKSATTALTGASPYPAGGGLLVPLTPPMCMFKTANNEALNVTVSAGTITGFMVYWDSDPA